MPLPPGLAIVVFDSGVRHELEHSGYADRRAELERGVSGDRRTASVVADGRAGAKRRRARRESTMWRPGGSVTSSPRTSECAGASPLSKRPAALISRLSAALFREGHESLRDDFEVSTPELDLLVDLAYEGGAIAARMTGGGFGGSIVALAEADRATLARRRGNERRTPLASRREATGYVCTSVDGAGDVEPAPVPA